MHICKSQTEVACIRKQLLEGGTAGPWLYPRVPTHSTDMPVYKESQVEVICKSEKLMVAGRTGRHEGGSSERCCGAL